jgi:hypothetical protein
MSAHKARRCLPLAAIGVAALVALPSAAPAQSTNVVDVVCANANGTTTVLPIPVPANGQWTPSSAAAFTFGTINALKSQQGNAGTAPVCNVRTTTTTTSAAALKSLQNALKNLAAKNTKSQYFGHGRLASDSSTGERHIRMQVVGPAGIVPIKVTMLNQYGEKVGKAAKIVVHTNEKLNFRGLSVPASAERVLISVL